MYINPISNYQSNNTTFNGRTIKVDNWTIFKNMFSKVGRQANSYIEKNDLKYDECTFLQKKLKNGNIAIRTYAKNNSFLNQNNLLEKTIAIISKKGVLSTKSSNANKICRI